MESIHCLVTGPLEVNTYIVRINEKCAFVIDAGGNAAGICCFLAEQSLDLEAIVLTHGHFDHIGAVPELKKRFPSARFLIHRADSRYAGAEGLKNQLADFGNASLSSFISRTVGNTPEPDGFLADSDVLFADSSVFAGGFTVLHTPGHSADSICLYNKAQKVLFSGDTLFSGAWGRTDLPGSDTFCMMQSLHTLASLPPDTAVFPGHGASTVISSEQEILQY